MIVLEDFWMKFFYWRLVITACLAILMVVPLNRVCYRMTRARITDSMIGVSWVFVQSYSMMTVRRLIKFFFVPGE